MNGKILKLFSNRESQTQLSLDINGVVNDKYYAKDIERSVLLSSKESYEMAKKVDINIKYGDLGENIIIDFNPYNLSIGSRIEIENVILEITQHCTLCKSLTKIDSKLPKLLKNDRGVFAKVIQDGTIYINSNIKGIE